MRLNDNCQAYAVRAMLALWLCTIVAFGLHEQQSFAWFDPMPALLPEWAKWRWVIPNLLASAWAWARPGSRAALLTAAAVTAVSLLAMHSWLGALPPWLPLAFLGFAWFEGVSAAEWKRAARDSLLLGMALTAAHKLNFDYLAGYEFSEGLFARIFPPPAQAWAAEHAALCARAWLLAIAATLFLFVIGRYRAALAVAALQALVSWYLYHVIFYDFYLVVPLWLAFDKEPLRQWRLPLLQRWAPQPFFVYLITMALFFLRYLYWRPQMEYYWPIILSGVASLALSSRLSSMSSVPIAPRGRRHLSWNILLAACLLAPWAFSAIPSPFGGTYFSAREVRYPPRKEIILPRRDGTCDWVFAEYATRWGYLVRTVDDVCKIMVYR